MSRNRILTGACLAMIFAGAADAGELLGAEVWGASPQLVSLDRQTGQSKSIGPIGVHGPWGLTHSSANETVYLIDDLPATSGLYSVNVSTGAATLIGGTGVYSGILARGLAWRATTNALFTVDVDGNQLYEIDASSGALEESVFMFNSGGYTGLTFDNESDQLYGIGQLFIGPAALRSLMRIDSQSGVATGILSLGPGSAYRGLAWDPELEVFWTHDSITGSLTKLDPKSQSITPVGSTVLPGQSGTEISALVFVPSECVADLDGDRTVDGDDLAGVLGAWGPCAGCRADIDHDGIVDGSDLAIVLGGWGDCE